MMLSDLMKKTPASAGGKAGLPRLKTAPRAKPRSEAAKAPPLSVAAKVERIEKAPLHERLYKELRWAIMRGRFAPGEALTIRELAAAFGTSVMPVRDALGRLVVEQAVEMPTARSFRIPQLTYPQFRQLCEFRMIVEGYAASLAAKNAQPSDIGPIESYNDEIAAALAAEDIELALDRNLHFMFSIYRAARTPVLLPHIESLWLRSGPLIIIRYRETIARKQHKSKFAVGHHPQIIKALRTHNAREAKAEVIEEIRATMEDYLRPEHFRPE